MGNITEPATSAPGYSSMRPNTCATLPEMLRLNGYATGHFGNCHEVPVWETSPAGPFDRWPCPGNGFERFYGFLGGETNQYYPPLVDGTTPVDPPATPEEAITCSPTPRRRSRGCVRGPEAYNHYAVGWAHAMCTPYQWTKQVASHWGGTRNATIVHWPRGIKAKGDTREQFCHVIDVAPTVLEVVGIPEPTEVNGHKGCSAVTKHRTPWITAGQTGIAFDDDVWELYDGSNDWSQALDLSKEHPNKLHELQPLFLIEAARHNVLPLDDRGFERYLPEVNKRPQLIEGNRQFAHDGGGTGKGGTATLYIDGKAAGSGRIEHTQPLGFSGDEPTIVGRNGGSPVAPEQRGTDDAFTGTIHWIELETGEDTHDHMIDPADVVHLAMGRQAHGLSGGRVRCSRAELRRITERDSNARPG
jgi:hypothetical protein